MENSLKGLILAAGTIITCIVISLGFFVAREAKTTATNGAKQINEVNGEFAENNKTIYDGASVSGSEVINLIRKFKNDDIGIIVKTNKSTNQYGNNIDISTGEMINTITTKTYYLDTPNTSSSYINPSAVFLGSVIRDGNNVITAISFTQ